MLTRTRCDADHPDSACKQQEQQQQCNALCLDVAVLQVPSVLYSFFALFSVSEIVVQFKGYQCLCNKPCCFLL